MNQKRDHGFSFYLQMLILLAVFLAVCTVLVQVFAGAWRLSRSAAAQNTGAQLCRTAAEAFSATGTAEGTAQLLGVDTPAQPGELTASYNGALAPDAAGAYRLQLTVTREDTAAGCLASAHITVTDQAGELFAQLDTAVYLPGQGGAAYAG